MPDSEKVLSGIDAVFILHGYRTGSNYVASVLANNNIGKPAEYFNREWQNSVKTLTPEALRRNVYDIIIANAYGNIFSCKLPIQDFLWLTKAIGDFTDPLGRITKHFRRSAITIVRRRDIFMQAVSFWRASTTGEWYRYQRTKEFLPPAPAYNEKGIYEAYVYLCREEYLWREIVTRSPISLIAVAYEEFGSDPNRLVQLLEQVADRIDPERTAISRDFNIVSRLVVLRDELSWTYRNRFIEDFMRSYAS